VFGCVVASLDESSRPCEPSLGIVRRPAAQHRMADCRASPSRLSGAGANAPESGVLEQLEPTGMATTDLEMQEPEASARAAATSTGMERDDCSTCLAKPREIRCLPCKHQATCERCTARHFLAELDRGHRPPLCPWCRAPVERVDRAKVDQEDPAKEAVDSSSSEAQQPPETRRCRTFRPAPPDAATMETVAAFLARVRVRFSGREGLAVRRLDRASIAAVVTDGLLAYCVTLLGAFLFIGVVFAVSRLLVVISDLELSNRADPMLGPDHVFLS